MKHQKKLFLLLMLSHVCCVVKAQDTIVSERTSIVTLSLLAPIFSYSPRYNVGYMYKVAPRWWVGLEAGYGSAAISFGDDADDYMTKDYRIFELRPEVYYSLRNTSRKLKHLVSAEVFYIDHKDHFTTDTFYENGGYPEYRYDAADYRRIKTGLNINYSLLFYFSERVGLSWKTGFGVKYRNVAYTNVVNKTFVDNSGNDEGPGGWFGIDNYKGQNGSNTNLSFNLDLKLFYKI